MGEVRDFLFPDLGEGLTEGEIVTWLVAVGDRVEVDQPIAEVSTEKAAVQVPTPFAGVVVTLHGEPGGTVQVGAPLISIDVTVAAAAVGPEPAAPPGTRGEPGTVTPATAASGNVLVGYGTAGEGVRRRPRVRIGDAPAPAASGNGTASRPADPPTERRSTLLTPASPLVRRRAALAGVELATVAATGPGGSVSRGDLDRHLQAAGPPDASQSPALTASPPPTDGERVRLSGVRRITAERLSRSHREVPDAAAWLAVDASGLLALRDLLNARQREVHVTPLAVLLRLCAAALRSYPALNAHVEPGTGDTVMAGATHLGVAVQAAHGLLVPVVRDAQQRTVVGLAAELNRLAAAARDGTIAATEMGGSTFTVSNFGAFGVDGGTAIINPPEAAILGVGKISRRAWVVGDEVVVRPVVELSLVFDHRACDGGTAGGFLRLLGDLVEHPELVVEEQR